jgi:hypothetical protein
VTTKSKSKGGKATVLKRECQNCEFFIRAVSGGPACDLTNDFTEPTAVCQGHVYRQACRVCGCSHHDPCEEGCWWVEPDLCSACA